MKLSNAKQDTWVRLEATPFAPPVKVQFHADDGYTHCLTVDGDGTWLLSKSEVVVVHFTEAKVA